MTYGLLPGPPGAELGIETPVSERKLPYAVAETFLRSSVDKLSGASIERDTYPAGALTR
jgi:hypothetical protein